jgi:hypothetical protein
MKAKTIEIMSATDVPEEKRETKYRSIFLGLWYALLGSVVIILGIVFLYRSEAFTPWHLVPFLGGVFLTTYGGNVASREASSAAIRAISEPAARLITAWRGGKTT